MIERLLKWLYGVLNAYSHRRPIYTRDNPWDDVSEWHTWPVSGYHHDAADAGWMYVGRLLKVEKDPLDVYRLYICGSLVLWSVLDPRWRRLDDTWRTFGGVLYHGPVAWEMQVGPVIFQYFYKFHTGMTGWHVYKLRASRDWYWPTKVRLGIKRAWRKAMATWHPPWLVWG